MSKKEEKKTERQRLTNFEKLEIVNWMIDNKYQGVQACRHFAEVYPNVSERVFQKWSHDYPDKACSNYQKLYSAAYSHSQHKTIKHNEKYKDLNKMVESEIVLRKEKKLLRDQRSVKTYGRECSKELGILCFGASNSWFYNRVKNSGQNHCLKIQSTNKTITIEEYLWKRDEFITNEYIFCNENNLLERNGNIDKARIYNCDEVPVQFGRKKHTKQAYIYYMLTIYNIYNFIIKQI